MDGREATQKVKDYFVETNGLWGVIAFAVENVEFDQASGNWIIECSFLPAMMAPEKYFYKVIVSDNGNIEKVEKVNKTG